MELLQDAHTWVLFSFLVFVAIMWKYAKDQILAVLDRRIETIRKEIERAESLRVESQELLAQYQRKQRDASEEAAEIIAAAHTHAAEIKKQAEKDIRDIAKRREEQLQDRLERMEKKAIQEIRTYAAELAVRATSEIIARQMDQKTNENLVEQSIRSVAGHIK